MNEENEDSDHLQFKMIVQCSHCGNIMETRSGRKIISCSKCKYKFKKIAYFSPCDFVYSKNLTLLFRLNSNWSFGQGGEISSFYYEKLLNAMQHNNEDFANYIHIGQYSKISYDDLVEFSLSDWANLLSEKNPQQTIIKEEIHGKSKYYDIFGLKSLSLFEIIHHIDVHAFDPSDPFYEIYQIEVPLYEGGLEEFSQLEIFTQLISKEKELKLKFEI